MREKTTKSGEFRRLAQRLSRNSLLLNLLRESSQRHDQCRAKDSEEFIDHGAASNGNLIRNIAGAVENFTGTSAGVAAGFDD